LGSLSNVGVLFKLLAAAGDTRFYEYGFLQDTTMQDRINFYIPSKYNIEILFIFFEKT